MLRNAFAEGSLVCRLQGQLEIDLWVVGAKAKGCELTLGTAKGTGTSVQPGDQHPKPGQGPRSPDIFAFRL